MRYAPRPVALALLIWYVPACTSYRATELAPADAVTGQRAVEVVNQFGRTIRLQDPWVRADSIGGTIDPICTLVKGKRSCETQHWAVPLTSIRTIATRQPDKGKTLTLVAVAGVAVVAAAAISSTCKQGSYTCW